MSEIPKEFFLGNNFPIEKSRMQKFNDCWALAGVSALGDIFSIDNNLEPIYLSSPYFASMANDACKFLKNEKDCKYTFNTGYNFGNLAYYMDDNKVGTKLDSCFPYDETLNFLLEDGYKKYQALSQKDNKKFPNINKNDWNTGNYYVLENIKNLCKNGCIKEKKINRNKKNICKTENSLRQNFELKIERPINIDMYPNLITKKSYTKDAIKNNQNLMKTLIFSLKKPIIASIFATEEYQNFFINENNEYFSPQKKLEYQDFFGHAVVILGWTLKDGLEYWIIRDTNFPDRFLNVSFSKYNNKDYWIGLDIKWDEYKNTNMSYFVKGDYGKNILNDYLNEGIFRKANISHDEL